MATVGVVKASITADTTQLKKGMTDAQRSMDRLGKQMSKVGKSMTMKVTMPLVGIGVAAAKMASDFEFSMTQIETLVGRSTQEVETLKGAVLGLSGQTGRAPKELADAMFFITSAGLDASSATAALEASAKAAAVGLGSTVIVADAVTNAMNGYGMSADGAAFATDVLAKTVEQGKASAADLAPQFGRLIPMAAELGISFDQVGGGLAFLTRASGDAAMSATQLGGVMKSFLKPSQQAKKVLEEIGVDLHDLRAAASADLLGALQGLREQLEANGFEMSNVFEDIRGLNGALQLTGVATGAAREVFDELANSTGKLDEAFKGVQKTAQFQMTQAMSAMKASMITLGEAVLPVVVPMLQGLASVIEKIAGWFGSLSSGMRTTIVVLGVIVAAIGPVLMIAGALTSALTTLGIVAAGATVSLSAILLPLAAIVAVGAVVFTLFNRWGQEAEEAAGRQQLLTDQMRDMNDPATTMVDRIDELVEANVRLKKAIDDSASANEDGADATEAFVGQATLQAELIDREVVGAFHKLGLAQEDVEAVVRTGTDAFNKEYDALNALSTNTHLQEQALRGEEDAVRKVAAAIRKKIADGEIELAQGVQILRSLDETADAHDDHIKVLEKKAKAHLSDAEKVQGFIDLLGEEKFESIKAAGAGKTHAEQLALFEDAVLGASTEVQIYNHRLNEAAAQNEMVATAQAEAAAEARALAATAAATAQMFADNSESAGEFRDALDGLPLHEIIARLNDGLGPALDLTKEKWDALVVSAQQADRAMLQSASGGTAFDIENETLTDTAHWAGVVANQRAAQVRAEKAIADELQRQKDALQDQKDALQDRINAQEDSLALAEAHLAELEAQAVAARAPVQALKDQADAERQGFEALRASRDAARGLADAVENVADIEAQIAEVRADGGKAIAEAEQAYRDQVQVAREFHKDGVDALQRQKDLTGEIADLAEERAFIEQEGGRFQRDLLHTLNQQRLAYFDINASVAELEGRQTELSSGALQAQRDLVASLQAQQAAVTEVEQALVDLEIVSATDAAQADISAKQAIALIKLKDGLAETETAVEAGEATTLDLIAAQDAYTKAVNHARSPIDGLQRATQDLSRMEEEAARIGLQLQVARDKQTLATEALTAAEETGARTAEAVDVIDRQLLVLEEQRTQATNDMTEAEDAATEAMYFANKMKDTSAIKTAELERLSRELEDAQWGVVAAQYAGLDAEIGLAEAGDTVYDALDKLRNLSPDLADEMEMMSLEARYAHSEFDTMRARLLELEPQIATAKSEVDRFKDAIAELVGQMELLNRTKVTVDGGTVTTTTPSGTTATSTATGTTTTTPTTPTGGKPPIAEITVDELRAGIASKTLAGGDLSSSFVELAVMEQLNDRLTAMDDALAAGHSAQDIHEFLATLAPSAASGGFIKRGGLVNVHAGETITPGGGATYITVNVEGSVSSERELVESIRKGLLRSQQSGRSVVLN